MDRAAESQSSETTAPETTSAKIRTVAAPLDLADFAALMAPFAPFEPKPHLAIAVSGGADSLALTLLADAWARGQGGRVTALTVDHRLRPAAAAEAAQAGQWMRARGIAHRVLVREGEAPRGDIQAAARAARYRLLGEWCEGAGVLHLLTAHHREDQAETLLLRLGRGSGLDGLAGMAAMVEQTQYRLLRPFLATPRARLEATLRALGQDWIEDPSNRNPAYARVRLRQAASVLAAEGLTAERLADTASRLARARTALEADVALLLARAVMLHPAGFVWLDPVLCAAAPAEIGLRALAAILATVGGAEFPPRLESLERLLALLPQGIAGRTLGGCVLATRRGGLLVCREAAAMAPPIAAVPGGTVRWDGRFALTLPASAPLGLTLGAVGGDSASFNADGAINLPPIVRPTLPALRDGSGILTVPYSRYHREVSDMRRAPTLALHFRPRRPLTGAGFSVV